MSIFAPSLMGVLFAVFLVFYFFSSAIKILREYERGVVFRLGRIIPIKGPGLVIILPVIDKIIKVSLRTVTMDVPPQDVITKDNISVKVNAVVYFRVIDPVKAITEVETFISQRRRLRKRLSGAFSARASSMTCLPKGKR